MYGLIQIFLKIYRTSYDGAVTNRLLVFILTQHYQIVSSFCYLLGRSWTLLDDLGRSSATGWELGYVDRDCSQIGFQGVSRGRQGYVREFLRHHLPTLLHVVILEDGISESVAGVWDAMHYSLPQIKISF
jgi:hypothetical protein